MNYYDRPEVSNSDLKELKRELKALEAMVQTFSLIFGLLVDAMLTEPFRVNHERRTLLDEKNVEHVFTEEEFKLAIIMRDRCLKDPVIRYFIDNAIGQYVFVRTLTFEYEGVEFSAKCRCKFDAYSRVLKMGADYKAVACETDRQMMEAVGHFDWDQQAAFYMDVAKIDKHWIIGISKKNGRIFKIAIQRGDAIYNAAKAKYTYWLYRWVLLIDNFLNPLQQHAQIS